VLKLRKRIKGESEIALDFEKIIPTPITIKDTVSGSLESVYTALFGTEEDVQEVLNKYDGDKKRKINLAVPEALTIAYPENRLKAFLAVIGSHASIDDGSDTLTEEKVMSYERMANNYNFNMKTYGVLNWYDWRVKNWGTKWNADCSGSSYQEKDGKSIYGLSFSTAWSPPEPVIRELAKQYPELLIQLRYYEGGIGFQGRLRLKGFTSMTTAESSRSPLSVTA